MSQRREKRLRQLERRVSALEAQTENLGAEVSHYWAETARQHKRDDEAEQRKRGEYGCRPADPVMDAPYTTVSYIEKRSIFRRIADFFSGR